MSLTLLNWAHLYQRLSRNEGYAATLNVLADGRSHGKIAGDLSLHGVTRPIMIPAYVTLLGDMLRANGDFSILQTDFGMKLASAAGGALKLKDELKLSFDVVARRKP